VNEIWSLPLPYEMYRNKTCASRKISAFHNRSRVLPFIHEKGNEKRSYTILTCTVMSIAHHLWSLRSLTCFDDIWPPSGAFPKMTKMTLVYSNLCTRSDIQTAVVHSQRKPTVLVSGIPQKCKSVYDSWCFILRSAEISSFKSSNPIQSLELVINTSHQIQHP
jgi:hypothetical protein